jgi:hypothetical protein
MAIKIAHGGNAGDLIYSLPAMHKASQISGQPVELILRTNVPGKYNFQHPLGSVQMNDKMAAMLEPLLLSTDFILSVQIVDYREAPKPDYDFDLFRKFHNYTGHISQWYFHIYPELTTDLSIPIHFDLSAVKPDRPILLNRTNRYHNPTFDYSILRPWQHLITFVGLPEEYRIISAKLPDITHTQVSDFAELYQLIKGSELFIGNQSMAYAIAEVSKQQRIVEVCPTANNVIPTGANGYGAFTALNLIQLMNKLYGRDKQSTQPQSK